MKSYMRAMKNTVLNYDEAEVRVREATSNDSWGASGSLLKQIADDTRKPSSYRSVINMTTRRLTDYQQLNHVLKALILIDYLLRNGDDRVIQDMKDRKVIIRRLKGYKYFKENEETGVNVRNWAAKIHDMLEDPEMLQSIRAAALRTQAKFAGYSNTDFQTRQPQGGQEDPFQEKQTIRKSAPVSPKESPSKDSEDEENEVEKPKKKTKKGTKGKTGGKKKSKKSKKKATSPSEDAPEENAEDLFEDIQKRPRGVSNSEEQPQNDEDMNENTSNKSFAFDEDMEDAGNGGNTAFFFDEVAPAQKPANDDLLDFMSFNAPPLEDDVNALQEKLTQIDLFSEKRTSKPPSKKAAPAKSLKEMSGHVNAPQQANPVLFNFTSPYTDPASNTGYAAPYTNSSATPAQPVYGNAGPARQQPAQKKTTPKNIDPFSWD